jgi:glutamate-5-semialdehyde dehydrogenase
MAQLGRQARAASRALALLGTTEKNDCLLAMADALEQNSAAIQAANTRDLHAGTESGLNSAMLDRPQA